MKYFIQVSSGEGQFSADKMITPVVLNGKGHMPPG
jgi:hypothetical protein